MDASPRITDWIIAIASVFAAVGTVGAVIVALWQILHQGPSESEEFWREHGPLMQPPDGEG